ncbi:hypothetical protein [Methylobacterium bullatum]|uniref:Plasmid recombination enzyme n=1 Tax=Methylobacterium bullatum TaxID=570505 RepID=A0A679JDK3_9HYPH|nr:hypothetical protein MBLL_00359 [Methylobacterium bullatum]
MDWKTCVRLRKIKTQTNLASLQSHGRRLDPSSKDRIDPGRTQRNIAFSAYLPEDPLNLVAAWEVATATLGASRYGRAAIAAHVLVIVSPGCVDAAGDRHDPANPINVVLVREAVAWAEQVFGTGSVFAGRLDVDEHGAGVVDLFVMPVRLRPMNARVSKRIITVAGALEGVRQAHGTLTSFEALQTSWWQHARSTIDPRLKRGTPKKETDRRHVHADVYRTTAAAIEPEIRAAAEAEVAGEIEARRTRLERQQAEAERHLAALGRQRREVEDKLAALTAERERLCVAAAAIERRARTAACEALDALSTGVRALLDGRIDRIEADAAGQSVLRFATQMPSLEQRKLAEVLRPGWCIGLPEALMMLQEHGANGRDIDSRTTSGPVI